MSVANKQSTLYMDLNVAGTLSASTLVPSAGCVTNSHVSATAAIQATKLVHQFPLSVELFAPATMIAATTKLIHIVQGATATIVSIQAACVTAPTGDHTAHVDLQKSTGGGAFATVLSATVAFSSSSTALTEVAGTISSASLVAGDILELIVTVAGSTSSQGAGLIATVFLREDPA